MKLPNSPIFTGLTFEMDGRRLVVAGETPSFAMDGWVCEAEDQLPLEWPGTWGNMVYLDDRTILRLLPEHPLCLRFRRWLEYGPDLGGLDEFTDEPMLEDLTYDEQRQKAYATLVINHRHQAQRLPLVWQLEWAEPRIAVQGDPEQTWPTERAPIYLWLDLTMCVSGVRQRIEPGSPADQYITQYIQPEA